MSAILAAKAVNTLFSTQKQMTQFLDEFKLAQEELGKFTLDKIETLNQSLELKEQEINDLDKVYKEKQRVLEVNMQLDLKEYGLDIAKEFLANKDFEVIKKEELTKLQEQVESHSETFAKLEKELQAKTTKEIEQMTNLLKAQSSAAIAKLEAELDGKNNYIEQLNDNIKHLRTQLETAQANVVKVATQPQPEIHNHVTKSRD
jgi:phosphoenolpyruvate synthase/pyruvate phosphate dikinase